MKRTSKTRQLLKCLAGCIALMGVAHFAHANDLLSNALEGDVQDSLGNGSMFWKVFILVDIILATAATIKSKNPMVFVGVAAVAFIPAFLLKAFVFH
ncbi:hypothetical protein [Legionella sp.]|uniref:hypothetical protein n=1 Tax=Legionella sp. TaxID=459 RepID=UPI0032202300